MPVLAAGLVAGGLLGFAAAQQPVTVAVGDLWFGDPSFENGVHRIEVRAGDRVVWDFSGAVQAHTTTECGASCDSPTAAPLWDSGVVMGGGAPFSFTFAEPGTYLYYCEVHPFEMRGQIVVQPAQPTAAPAPLTPEPEATGAAPAGEGTATPLASGREAGLPITGHGPPGAAPAWWPAAALAAAGLALAGLGSAAWYTGRRR